MTHYILRLLFIYSVAAETWQCSENKCGQTLYCKSPKSNLHNGWIEDASSGPYVIGSSIDYSCNTGYLPTGDSHRVCLGNGTWSSGPIACKAIDCGFPNIINEAEHSFLQGATTYPSTLVVSCNGYDHWASCNLRGQWKPGNQCMELDVDVNNKARGTCNALPAQAEKAPVITRDKAPYYTGRKVQYQCQFGYAYIRGNTTYTCTKGGDWRPSLVNINCSRTVCKMPWRQTENGLRLPENRSLFYVGDTVSYKCYKGYRRAGSWYRTCQEDGTWSGQPASCKEVQCKDPQVYLKHGRVEPQRNTYTYGDKLKYTCYKGYTRIGPWRRGCLEDGTWSGKDIWCKALRRGSMGMGSGLWNSDGTCGAPPAPADLDAVTSADYGPYFSGSTVHYDCADGYQYVRGAKTHKCTRTGLWRPGIADITCKESEPSRSLGSKANSIDRLTCALVGLVIYALANHNGIIDGRLVY